MSIESEVSKQHPWVTIRKREGDELFYSDRERAFKKFEEGFWVQDSLRQISPHIDSQRRFFNYEWTQGVGHIGLIGQYIKHNIMEGRPAKKLIVEHGGLVGNQYFLDSMIPHIEVHVDIPPQWREEAQCNAVFYSAPCGKHVWEWAKEVERRWERFADKEPICQLSDELTKLKIRVMNELNIRHPYIALHARQSPHDESRNLPIALGMVKVEEYYMKGYDAVSIGLDDHPINDCVKSIKGYPEVEQKAISFALSACCDVFVGSDSGMWQVANQFNRRVDLLNDWDKLAWIYD
jgi:hypothetical protein